MTSLFEHDPANDVPADLLSSGRRGVALLEFMAVGAKTGEDGAAGSAENFSDTDSELDSAVQLRAMLEAAREDATAETQQVLGEEFAERIRSERRRVERLLVEFGEQRRIFFTQAEAAVVRLSLLVAAKILQHEADADVMLLSATVRAALSRIQDGSSAVVRVRPEEAGVWEQVFAEDGFNKVEIAGDKSLRLGDCVMETSLGRVELGVVAQLGEIERGFRELLERAGV